MFSLGFKVTPDIGHRNGLLADECTQQTYRWVTTDIPRHVIKIVAEKIMLFRPCSEVTRIRRHLIELVATLTNLRREGCTANSVHKSTLVNTPDLDSTATLRRMSVVTSSK